MNDNDVLEIDLLQVFKEIKKNLLLFISICLITCAAGYAVSSFLIPKKYEATAKIIIVKEENGSNSAVTYNDIQLSQKLASTYKQILMSEAISDEVIDNLNLNESYGIDTEAYGKIVSINAADSTEVMNITTKTTDPKLSADIANEIVDVFISKIYDIMEVQNVTILNGAKVPTKKTSPSNMKSAMIGGLIGAMICALITLIKILTDTKVKTEEEVKQIFTDVPVIGMIPDFLEREIVYDEEV